MLIGEALDTIWTLGWAFLAWLALVSLAATLALHAALALTRAVVHAARGTARPRRSAVPEYTDPTAQMAAEIPTGAQQQPEAEAAATLARECSDLAAVILWCADRVRSVDDSPAVQDAADYLHDLSTRAQVDTASNPTRPAIIRECAQQIHSMGGDGNVERAAEYLDDLATEADEATGAQQRTLPCSPAVLRRPHAPHAWQPQPGMTPVPCPGTAPAKEARP